VPLIVVGVTGCPFVLSLSKDERHGPISSWFDRLTTNGIVDGVMRVP
jgi:hypothetical protein